MTPAPRPLCDLYLRLSDPENELSFEGREQLLREDVARLGWDVNEVLLENDVLPDGRVKPASAYKRRKVQLPDGRTEMRVYRPAFRKLLDHITHGVVQAAFVEDLDRLARDPYDGEDLIAACEQTGASIRSHTGSLTLTNGGTTAEQFQARILVVVAQKSSADTSRRVKAARERLAGSSYQGGLRPYGYRVDPDSPQYRRRLVTDEQEAKVLQRAADELLLGIPVNAIARRLREEGVPTSTGKGRWTGTLLKQALIKPATAGLAVSEGALVAAPWPPILDRDRWEALRELFAARATGTGTANAARWLLSQIATCGVCGGPAISGGSNRGYRGSRCSHFSRSAAECDAIITKLIVDRLSEPDADELLRPPAAAGPTKTALKSELRKLRDRRKAQIRMHAEGILDDDDLASGARAISKRMAEVNATLAATAGPDPLAEFRDRPAQTVWDSLSLERRRTIVRALFTSIVIERRGGGRRGPVTLTTPERVGDLTVTWAPGV